MWAIDQWREEHRCFWFVVGLVKGRDFWYFVVK